MWFFIFVGVCVFFMFMDKLTTKLLGVDTHLHQNFGLLVVVSLCAMVDLEFGDLRRNKEVPAIMFHVSSKAYLGAKCYARPTQSLMIMPTHAIRLIGSVIKAKETLIRKAVQICVGLSKIA